MKVFGFGIAFRNGDVICADHDRVSDDARRILAQLIRRPDQDGRLSAIFDPTGHSQKIVDATSIRSTDSVDILNSRHIQRLWADVATPSYFDVGRHVQALYVLRLDEDGTGIPNRFDGQSFQMSHVGEKMTLADGVQARVEVYRRRAGVTQS